MIDWDAMVGTPCNSVFGELVIYTPAGLPSYDIQLTCDEGNKDINLAGGAMALNSSNPIASGQLSAFKGEPLQGDTLVIVRTGERWVVKDVNEDGKGSVTLALNYLDGGL